MSYKESFQSLQDISPRILPLELSGIDHIQPDEEVQPQNMDPQALDELVLMLKKLRYDIDRLLKIFNIKDN